MKINYINDFKIWIQANGFKPLAKKNGIEQGYVNNDKTIIIDFAKDSGKSFVIHDLERIDDKDNIISSMYEQFKKEVVGDSYQDQKKEDNKKAEIEPQPETQQMDALTSTEKINSIPSILEGRIITSQDIDEWKKKTVFERLLYFQKTPKNLIKRRRGYLLPEFAGRDKKSLTNEHYKMFQYVEGNVMQTEANIAFLFEWSFCIEETKFLDKEVIVRGYIQVEINGKLIRRACGGSMIQKGNMDMGDTLEGAITEAKKRGLKSFGFNRDVYNQEEVTYD